MICIPFLWKECQKKSETCLLLTDLPTHPFKVKLLFDRKTLEEKRKHGAGSTPPILRGENTCLFHEKISKKGGVQNGLFLWGNVHCTDFKRVHKGSGGLVEGQD